MDTTDHEQMLAELAQLDIGQMEAMARRLDWLRKARPRQIAPDDFFVWLLNAGRGSGKTRAGAEEMWWPASRTAQRIAVIGPTLGDVRKTCFEGESGLLACVPPRLVVGYNRSLCELWVRAADGGESYFVGYSSEEPDRLRGPQHHRAWCDELAAWRYIEETWDMMMFGLRLGQSPDVVVTTTPKPVGLLRKLIRDTTTVVATESTFANAGNLPPRYLAELRKKYEGTRLGRQELYAELLDDNPYALWNQEMLDRSRILHRDLPDLERIVVSVDPPVTSGEDADECGIVAAGTSGDDAYVLHDWTVQGASPQAWAARAVSLYHHVRADAIVAEVNQGGEMVETIIRQVDPDVPVHTVHATRGKVVRAEPVSALYEQRRVHHVGNLPHLEDQMCDFTTDFDKKAAGYSPDRVDALVWALTSLLLDDDYEYSMVRAAR